MADNPCSIVKTDIEAGTFTRFTTDFPIYVDGVDKYQGGNYFIHLSDPIVNPIQGVDGGILYNKQGCKLLIHARNIDSGDDIYDDIIDILKAVTSRSYVFQKLQERPNLEFYNKLLEVNFIP